MKKSRESTGELGNPLGCRAGIDLTSSIECDADNKQLIAHFTLLNTPRGKIAKELITRGTTVGLSLRGEIPE
jgi:hypothetical protein